MPRTILHVDMDAFFVAVEQLRRPELRGRPVVVGGAGVRGVVAAASYEARRFGVSSAMPMVRARRQCPGLVVLPADHAHYAEVSRQVMQRLRDVTPLVEPLALDEAFCDVTGSLRLLGPAVEIAQGLRARIHDELGLPCSVGIATSKMLAKLASEAAKPRVDRAGVRPGAGVIEVVPGDELAFLHPHPVRALWGVGPATFAKLDGLGIRTVGDLAALDQTAVQRLLGRANGAHLWMLAQGIDPRPVEPDRDAKSHGHEETFATDRHTIDELRAEVVRLADAVAGRLRAAGVAARTITLKVRYRDFSTLTRSVTPGRPIDTAAGIVRALEPVMAALDPGPGVRLLGVSGSNLVEPAVQLSLEPEDSDEAWSQVSATLDEIRSRFGRQAISPASGLRSPPRPEA